MNLYSIYAGRHQIPQEFASSFVRKDKLNQLELIALEAILCKFIQQYEEEELGEVYSNDADLSTYWHADGVSILDGVCDTYIFNDYAIADIWCTEAGCVLLSCYHLQHDEYDDPEEVVRCIDWQSECEEVLFRLD